MHVMQKAVEGNSGSQSLQDAKPQMGGLAFGGFAMGAIPFGLERHLANIPVLGRLEGE